MFYITSWEWFKLCSWSQMGGSGQTMSVEDLTSSTTRAGSGFASLFTESEGEKAVWLMWLIKDEDKLQASFYIETPSGEGNIGDVKHQWMPHIQAAACNKEEFLEHLMTKFRFLQFAAPLKQLPYQCICDQAPFCSQHRCTSEAGRDLTAQVPEWH